MTKKLMLLFFVLLSEIYSFNVYHAQVGYSLFKINREEMLLCDFSVTTGKGYHEKYQFQVPENWYDLEIILDGKKVSTHKKAKEIVYKYFPDRDNVLFSLSIDGKIVSEIGAIQKVFFENGDRKKPALYKIIKLRYKKNDYQESVDSFRIEFDRNNNYHHVFNFSELNLPERFKFNSIIAVLPSSPDIKYIVNDNSIDFFLNPQSVGKVTVGLHYLSDKKIEYLLLNSDDDKRIVILNGLIYYNRVDIVDSVLVNLLNTGQKDIIKALLGLIYRNPFYIFENQNIIYIQEQLLKIKYNEFKDKNNDIGEEFKNCAVKGCEIIREIVNEIKSFRKSSKVSTLNFNHYVLNSLIKPAIQNSEYFAVIKGQYEERDNLGIFDDFFFLKYNEVKNLMNQRSIAKLRGLYVDLCDIYNFYYYHNIDNIEFIYVLESNYILYLKNLKEIISEKI